MYDSRVDLQNFLQLLRLLIREPSVVGVEDAFFRVLRRELDEYPVAVTQYHGLLVVQGSDPESIYVSAHVDRHGLLCTGPQEFQYAAFIAGNRGELNGDSISEQFMELIAGRFHGQRVQAHAPHSGYYLGQGVINESYICPRRKNLIFEIDGLDFLQPGTPVSFVDRLQEREAQISAQLDNVVSVAMLVELIRRGFQGTAFFTAGEECGRSYRYLAEWFQRMDSSTRRLIVLDTSPFPNLEELRAHEVVLRNRDSVSEFDPAITAELRQTCERLKLPFRFKDEYVLEINRNRESRMSIGRTELGRLIAVSGDQISGTTLQLPTTSYHTQTETATLSSVAAVLNVLLSITSTPC